MSFLKRLGWPMTPTNNATTAGSSSDPATSSPPRSLARQPRQGRRGRMVLKSFAMVFGAIFVAVASVLLITWHSDYWQLRDRLVHIHEALFGDYIPPECRTDASQCVRDRATGRLVPKPRPPDVTGRPAAAACQGPEGLALYCQLHTLFDYFNAELFEGRLPKALITLQRKEGAGGFYWHQRYRKAEGGRIDEIAINPNQLGIRSPLWVASILIHEMVHMEQAYFGKPGDNGFHNAEWGRMMKRVGLHPSSTGKPSGQQTGTRMSHYVIPGGAFERAAAQHPILKNERLAFFE